MTYDNIFSTYHAEYRYNIASWCLNSTENFLTSVPLINVFNENGENCTHDVEKCYRTRGTGCGWQPLKELEGSIPQSIQIRVKFPDGKEEIRSFFYLGDVKYITSDATLYDADIKWENSSNIRISCLDLEGVDVTSNGKSSFHLHRTEDNIIFPSVCTFVIFAPACPPTKLAISSPFKGLAILDSEGKEVVNGTMLCTQNLYNYKIFAQGIGDITIKLSYISDDIEDTKSLEIHRPSNGIMSLSDINDLLDRLFMLYERRAFNRSSFVMVTIKGSYGSYKKSFRVRHYSLDTKMLYPDSCVVMDIDDNPDDDVFTRPQNYSGRLLACIVSQQSNALEVLPLRETTDSTKFEFPNPDIANQFIVFSDKYDRDRVIPRYYNLEVPDLTVAQRIAIRRARLKEYENVLDSTSLSSEKWDEVFQCYKVVTENNLVFSTFDCFISIAKSPKLIAKFVLGLCYNGYSDNCISDFNRYAGELAFSLHWIRPEIWIGVLQSINTLGEMEQKYLMNDVVKFMTDVFKTELYQGKANEFSSFLMSNKIEAQGTFYPSDLREYKASIHGVSDTGQDLPTTKIVLSKYIFPKFSIDTLPWQKVAMLCPVKIAELLTENIDNGNFWEDENEELRRVINFYRIYATKTYSRILIKALSIYTNL